MRVLDQELYRCHKDLMSNGHQICRILTCRITDKNVCLNKVPLVNPLEPILVWDEVAL
jgi:hypothetical protein